MILLTHTLTTERQIELVEEYRIMLMETAVTGKIDVRSVV